jgi:hypothetical protein
MQITYIREEIERKRRQILRQRREIRDLQRAGIPTKSRKSCWPGCFRRSMTCAQSATGWWANVASSNALFIPKPYVGRTVVDAMRTFENM